MLIPANAGPVEVKRLDIGRSAVGDKDMRDVEHGFLAAARDHHADALAARLDCNGGTVEPNVDALFHQPRHGNRSQLRIGLREGIALCNHGHLRAETVEGLGNLEPHCAAADHNEVGETAGIVEDRFEREIRDGVEAGNPGHDRSRAGRDDETARLDHELARADGPRVGETRIGHDGLHASRLQPGDRVARGQTCDDLVDAFPELAGIDAQLILSGDPIGHSRSHGLGVGGGRRQGF